MNEEATEEQIKKRKRKREHPLTFYLMRVKR